MNAPDLPVTMRHVWNYFMELCGARSSGMGLNPISYSEIKAWDDLTGAEITPKEVQIIKALDSIYLTHQNKKAK